MKKTILLFFLMLTCVLGLAACSFVPQNNNNQVDHLHRWNKEYVWSDDYSTCTANAVCDYDGEKHTLTETVSSVPMDVVEATCNRTGHLNVKADFQNPVFDTQIETITLPQLSHEYGEAVYEWIDDYKKCKATKTCAHDSSHIVTETVKSVYNVVTSADYEKNGLGVYTAVFAEDSPFATQNYEVVLPQLPLYNYTETDGGYIISCASYDARNYLKGEVALPSSYNDQPIVAVQDFSYCEQITKIIIPQSVKRIENGAFDACYAIKEIILPEGLLYIGGFAFNNGDFVSIEIPSTVTEFGYKPFFSNKLKEIIYSGTADLSLYNMQDVSTIKDKSESKISTLGDYVLYNDGTKTYIIDYVGAESVLHITADTPHIGNWAFNGNKTLKEVVFENGVESIGDYAFYECFSLEKISFPNYSLSKIGNSAFCLCTSLRRLNLTPGITQIGDAAFSGCYSLIQLVIQNKAKISYGKRVFQDCFRLVEVLNKSGTEIKKGGEDYGYAGYYAINVENSTAINLEITSKIVEEDGLILYKFGSNYVVDYVGEETEITVPDLTYQVNKYAFFMRDKLVSITLPDSVDVIWEHAFDGCTSLVNVNIPKNVKVIHQFVFANCKSLGTITLPSNVNSIEQYAFGDAVVNTLNVYSDLDIKDMSMVRTNIKTLNFYRDLVTWMAVKGKDNLNYTNIHLYFDGANESRVVDFTGYSNYYSLADYEFRYCQSINTIILSNQISSIGNYALAECYHLSKIILGSALNSIGDNAFKNVSLTEIINYSELNVRELNIANQYTLNVIIDEQLTRIRIKGDFMLYDNGDEIVLIDYMGNAEKVTIPEEVTTIGTYAFNGNQNVKIIDIPKSVTVIQRNAFTDCRNIVTINYDGTANEWSWSVDRDTPVIDGDLQIVVVFNDGTVRDRI